MSSSTSRLPQVGDIVVISYRDKDFTRNIISIKGSIIYFSDSSIIWQNNRWEFPNGIGAENVRFFRSREERLESSVFTGSHLTDMHVLAAADDKTFYELCRTNMRLGDICTNPRYQSQLYEMRVQAHFPEYYPLFGTEWGKSLNKKLDKPSWKTIYQKLVKMEKDDLLYLLTAYEPTTYPRNHESTWNYGINLPIMGKYPDIFKFVYPVNPSIVVSVQAYIQGTRSRDWKEILEVLRWLLELNELESTLELTRYAILVGNGTFINYLIQEKRLVLNRDQINMALSRGAGNILDLYIGATPPFLVEESGMENALQMGNIEGLEAFHSRGIRLGSDDLIDRVDQYPEDTIKWLWNHEYYTPMPLFLDSDLQ